MKQATIYDFARFCEPHDNCEACKLYEFCFGKNNKEVILEANEIILNWCKEHPVETRQDSFLKIFPNADIYKGAINICPCKIDCDYDCENKEKYVDFDCTGCKKEYWLEEVDENE